MLVILHQEGKSIFLLLKDSSYSLEIVNAFQYDIIKTLFRFEENVLLDVLTSAEALMCIPEKLATDSITHKVTELMREK